ncbi:MAG: (2Fe-2S) ferredoxin domain-containing protein [Candidatus Gastranaerophilaceae bacterium]
MSKLNITVCMGSSCFARGNQQNLAFIESFIQEHGLEAEINLAGSRCENQCAKGPNIIVNNVEYNNVDEKKLEEILSQAV